MIKKLPISVKLGMAFFVSGLCIIVGMGTIMFLQQSTTLKSDSSLLLTSIRDLKKHQVEAYFRRKRLETITLAQNPTTIAASRELIATYSTVISDLHLNSDQLWADKQAVQEYYKNEMIKRLNAGVLEERKVEQYLPTTDAAIALQYLYIASNPNPTGSKDNLEMATDGSKYSAVHNKYHSVFRDFVKRFNFYDMFIIDPETGVIVYTAFKEVDFTSNLLNGPYRDTNIAMLFKKCLTATSKETVHIVDFAAYDPSYGAPAAFVGAPVFDGEKKVAIMIFQLSVDEINNMMTDDKQWQDVGLGRTGEAYLVASDYKMRSISRLFIENPQRYLKILEIHGVDKKTIDQIRIYQSTVLLQEVNTNPVKDLLRGVSGIGDAKDYLGFQALASYSPLTINELSWGIVVEKHDSEISAPLYHGLRILGFWSAGLLLIIFFLFLVGMILFFGSLRRLVTQLKSWMKGEKISLGSLLVTTREDEIGNISSAINELTTHFSDSLHALDTSLENAADGIKDSEVSCSVINQRLSDLATHLKDLQTEYDAIKAQRSDKGEREKKITAIYDQLMNQLTILKQDMGTKVPRTETLQKTVAEVRTMVQDLSKSVAEHKEYSEKNSASVTDARHSLDTTNVTLDQAAKNMKSILDKNQYIYEFSKKLRVLVSMFKRTANEANAVAINAYITAESIGTSQGDLAKVAKDIKVLVEKIGAITKNIQRPLAAMKNDGVVKEIQAYTDEIKSMSDKVDVVTLNFSIRTAGEANPVKTFSAVSQEIKRLATDMISTVQKTDEDIADLEVNAADGFRLSKDVFDKVQGLEAVVDEALGSIKELATQTQAQSKIENTMNASLQMVTNYVVDVLRDISASSEYYIKFNEYITNTQELTKQFTNEFSALRDKNKNVDAIVDQIMQDIKFITDFSRDFSTMTTTVQKNNEKIKQVLETMNKTIEEYRV